jgi:hypothetical protein
VQLGGWFWFKVCGILNHKRQHTKKYKKLPSKTKPRLWYGNKKKLQHFYRSQRFIPAILRMQIPRFWVWGTVAFE